MNTSLSMLDGMGRGDDDAWRRLCDLFGPELYVLIRSFGVQPADAEDVAQEVLLKIFRKLSEFDRNRGGTFTGWFRTIARRETINLLRQSQKTPKALGGTDGQAGWQQLEDETFPPEEASTADFCDESRIQRRATEFFLRLQVKPRDLAVYELHLLGWSAKQIVAEMKDRGHDLKEANVYQIKARVERDLKNYLAGLVPRVPEEPPNGQVSPPHETP